MCACLCVIMMTVKIVNSCLFKIKDSLLLVEQVYLKVNIIRWLTFLQDMNGLCFPVKIKANGRNS